MRKIRLKWFFYFAAPLIVFFVPYSGVLNKYFSTITLQPQKTGISTLNFFDESRSRPVITEVWYPVDRDEPALPSPGFWLRCDESREAPLSAKKSKYPLIMMSHGSGADRYTISWLAEILVANGYIVAAMDHYGNTWNNKIPEYYARPWERPKDVTFALDNLLETPKFKDRVDAERIGFAGYSLGGATGIWIAGAQASLTDLEKIKRNSLRDLGEIVPMKMIETIDFTPAEASYLDERISAMVLMAPALGWLFEERSLEKIGIPVYIFAAESDDIAPTENNAMVYANNISRASLKVFTGQANHYVFLNRATAIGKRFLDPKYYSDPGSVNRKKVHDEIAKKSVVFFNDQLKKS